MKSIILGKSKSKKVSIDLKTLLRTRLLIQANSGGGKSWLLRLIAERAFGKVQTIIIDPEGEFATLREKYDYVLVGKGGETPADVRSAELVAQKLLELNASAVCDLYESFRKTPKGRREWVANFLEALIDAPKNLWRPLIVIVDEAHKFCPQEMPRVGDRKEREIISRCKDAMISLSTTGRKRGFCAVWATQRLAKLDKDASAELLNRLVGLTFEDVDIDRAVDLMSVSRDERLDFKKSIRVLEPGNFYAIGRAISTARTQFMVDSVETTHPDIESHKFDFEPPPPPAKIKLLLPKLADLPKEAEAKAKTEKELRAEIAKLKHDLMAAQRYTPIRTETKPEKIEIKIPFVPNGELKRIEKIVKQLERITVPVIAINKSIGFFSDFSKQLVSASNELSTVIRQAVLPKTALVPQPVPRPALKLANAMRVMPSKREMIKPSVNDDGSPLGKGERICLIAIAQHSEGVARDTITQLTGYKRSSRDAYLQRLRNRGFINDGITITATPAGIEAIGEDYEPLPTGYALQQYWMQRLPAGERSVLSVAVDAYPDPIERELIDETTGYKRSSRDAYINRLQSRRLLEQGSGAVKASDKLFD